MKETCSDLREALLDFVDGRADGASRVRVQTHLEGCERCRAMVVKLGEPLAFGTVTVPPQLSMEMNAAIVRQIENLAPPVADAGHPGLFRWLFSGAFSVPKPLAWAMVILLLFLSTDHWRHAEGPRPPAPAVLMDGIDHLEPLSESNRS